MAQPSFLCFSHSRSATAGTQASHGAMAQVDSNSPPLEEPTVGVGVIPAAESSPVADPLETGHPCFPCPYCWPNGGQRVW